MSDNTAVTQQTPDEPESKRRIVVEARVREVVVAFRQGASNIWITPEFLTALEEKVERLIEDAVNRCGHNKRSKLRAQDL